jgi:D-lyxose ketol-isomerase
MKRSEINQAIRDARAAFDRNGWVLPPNPRWDVTDLGLGTFSTTGLVLINLAEEPEYCEKLMFSRYKQVTPLHTHKQKKEDIICRNGKLTLELWAKHPEQCNPGETVTLSRNGEPFNAGSGEPFTIESGERVTLVPGVYHAFWAESENGCVVGEVSTANDDANDNFFVNPEIGRFPEIEEDEPPLLKLLSEK